MPHAPSYLPPSASTQAADNTIIGGIHCPYTGCQHLDTQHGHYSHGTPHTAGSAHGLSPGAGSAPARKSLRPAAQPRTWGSLTNSDTAVTLRVPDSPRKSEVTALAGLILGARHVSAIISTTSFYFGGVCYPSFDPGHLKCAFRISLKFPRNHQIS